MSPEPTFSLVDGGPLCALMRRLGLVRPDGRCDYLRVCIVIVAVAWGPQLVLAMVYRLMTGRFPPVMHDWGIHARLLVAIPLFFKAESSLHMRTRLCIDWFKSEHWAPDDADKVDRIVASGRRLRDGVIPELSLLVLALIGSQAVVWNVGGLFQDVHLTMSTDLSAAKGWHAFVALPAFQFLLYRGLWRWIIWTQLLWRLSRLRVQPVATHPDLSGGLEFLSMPSDGFAYFIAALAAVQAGVWANQVLYEGADVMDFKSHAILFAAAAVVVALGPTVTFSGHLWRCRFAAARRYGDLATDYTRQFQRRWIDRPDPEGLLGSLDIQSLADLGNSYGVIDKMRVVPFGLKAMIGIALAALVPMLPLALLEVSLVELITKVGGALLGKPGI